MEFVLNEYHRNVPEEDLLSDLVSVANQLNQKTLSLSEYSKHGKYSGGTFRNRFGSWSNALKKAGLEQKNVCTSINDFIDDVKNLAAQLKKTSITVTEYQHFGSYHHHYFRYHNLGWDDVLKMAGLNSTPYHHGKNKTISDIELFEEIERVWIKLGRQPTSIDIEKGLFKYGRNTFGRRFGSWRKALEAFVDYINSSNTSDCNNTNENDVEQVTVDHSPEQQMIRHKTNREPNLRLRFKVLLRDNFKCSQCGRSPATDSSVELHVDHIYPWAKGGETTFDNLRTLCKECNLGKSDLIL